MDTKNQSMKMTSISGICKTIYCHGSYLLLFAKRQWQSFEVLSE